MTLGWKRQEPIWTGRSRGHRPVIAVAYWRPRTDGGSFVASQHATAADIREERAWQQMASYINNRLVLKQRSAWDRNRPT